MDNGDNCGEFAIRFAVSATAAGADGPGRLVVSIRSTEVTGIRKLLASGTCDVSPVCNDWKVGHFQEVTMVVSIWNLYKVDILMWFAEHW